MPYAAEKQADTAGDIVVYTQQQAKQVGLSVSRESN